MSLRNHHHLTIDRRHLFGLAAGLGSAALLGAPAVAAAAPPTAEARQVIPVSARRKDPDAAARAASAEIETAAAAGNVVVNIDFQYQETGYWCGPAATRHALSARGSACPSSRWPTSCRRPPTAPTGSARSPAY